jgi:hypothetical protein
MKETGDVEQCASSGGCPASSGRRHRAFRAWRFPSFQNSSEARVSRTLLSHFRAPDYHLMNHVTLRMDDGTTEVDHILVSRYGVFGAGTRLEAL